jgi:hypothetical protein
MDEDDDDDDEGVIFVRPKGRAGSNESSNSEKSADSNDEQPRCK